AGGNLGATNSVAWMFDRKGQIYIDAARYADEEALLEKALEAGAEDFARDGEQYVLTTEPTQLHAVQSALQDAAVEPVESEIALLPKNTVRVEGKNAESVLKLMEELEDLDDVQKVAANFDIDIEEMETAR